MKKYYQLHEQAYRKMTKAGIDAWDQLRDANKKPIDPNTERTFEDIHSQEWFPNSGNLLELGCGTGVISRWFHQKGYQVTGIDISETAIEMSKRLSEGLENIAFFQGDVTKQKGFADGSFDIVIDGHCLHCIINVDERRAFFESSRRVLKKDGILSIATMALPGAMELFHQLYAPQILKDGTIYCPYEQWDSYDHSIEIDGQGYIGTRKILHYEAIMNEMRAAGFHIQYMKVHMPTEEEPFADLSLVGIKR